MICQIVQTHTCIGWEVLYKLISHNTCHQCFNYLSGHSILQFLQVARVGRFGTQGLAITFVSSALDYDILKQVWYFFLLVVELFEAQTSWIYVLWLIVLESLVQTLKGVQERFEVDIKELPEQIDTSTYSMSLLYWLSCSSTFFRPVFGFCFLGGGGGTFDCRCSCMFLIASCNVFLDF